MDAMSVACDGGHDDVMRFLMYIADKCLDGGELLNFACYAGRLSLVEYLITGRGREETVYWPGGLCTACSTGQVAVVAFLLPKCLPIDWTLNNQNPYYNSCLSGAAAPFDDGFYSSGNCEPIIGYNAGHPKIVRMLLATGRQDLEVDKALKLAVQCPQSNDEIITMLIRSATNIADAFDAKRDAETIIRLLTTTDFRRTVFADIPGIQTVFDAADRIAADVSSAVDAVGLPAVLQRMVAECCVMLQ